MLRYDAHSDADASTVWTLLARPHDWPRWAPHVRGAWGLAGASGEVEVGHRGAARLLGVVPVPARITAKEPGRSWTWRVGGTVDMVHAVEPDADGRGCTVAIELRAPPPVERALRVSYGPLVQRLVERLSRTAAARPRPTRTGTPPG